MLKNKTLISLAIFIIVCGILLILNLISLSQQKILVYDFTSYHPYGYKAVSLLCKKTALKLTEVDSLPDNQNQLLMIITTGKLPFTKQRELLQWVKSGGTVFELAQSQPVLDLKNSSQYRQLYFGKKTFHSSYEPISGLTYHLYSSPVFTVSNSDKGFMGDNKNYFIYQQLYGQGAIIFWNDPDGLTNRYLTKHPDNAVIFLKLIQAFAPSQDIFIYDLSNQVDDKAFNWNRNLFNRYWGVFFLFSLGLVLLIWKLAARFGRPRPLILAQGHSFDEFIISMASLFQQANTQQLVLDNQWRSLIKIVSDITNQLSGAFPESIKKLTELTGRDYQELARLYQQYRNGNQKLPKPQFLALTIKLDAYRKEILEWKKSNHYATR